MSWPAGGVPAGELRRQFAHVTDIFPTFLEIAGVERPDSWRGNPVLPLAGASVAATLTDADAPGRTLDVVIENEGHRGYRRDGWEAVTRHEPRTAYSTEPWELFDMANDPTQVHDLSGDDPERLAELRAAWEAAAWENQMFPLDEGTGYRFLLRPPWTETYDQPVVIPAGTPSLDRWRSQRLILWRDATITASVELAAGDAGMLVSHGDQGGGYAMYVDTTGELVAVHNGYGLERELRGPIVAPGADELTLQIRCPGDDEWDLAVEIDGVEVAAAGGFRLLMAMAPFQGIDVGIDRKSPVSWAVHQRHGSFPFTGMLHQVAYLPGDPAPDHPENFMEFLSEWGRTFE